MIDPEDVDDTDMTEDEFDARMDKAAEARASRATPIVYNWEPAVLASGTAVTVAETIRLAGNQTITRRWVLADT